MAEPTAPPIPLIASPLTTSAAGLTEADAAARRAEGLGNDVPTRVSRSYWDILRQNAYPAINGVLLSVAVLLVFWGLYVEALVTAGPVLGIIVVGVIQEGRAKRSLDQIALLTAPRATVLRQGVERAIDPAELVVGDILVARRGDQVVLDGTIVGQGRVELDESLLTGESDPIPKDAGHEVWSGSAVVSGTVVYEATAVGTASLAGHLVGEARDARHDQRTPLQHEIAVMIWTVAGLVALTAFPVAWSVQALSGDARATETLGAAAVLVSLIPQGLAIMVTFTYAAGALRVSKLGALVQRQNAIESISRVTTLCVDKTGTLTTQRIVFDGAAWVGPTDAVGPTRGARADGGLDSDAQGEVHGAALGLLLGAIAASSRAPNRTTAALAEAHPAPAAALADEVPFASQRRWSGLCFGDVPADGVLASAGVLPGAVYVLGAPSVVLDAASLAPEARASIADRVREGTARGERVLLLARAADGAPIRDGDEHPVLPVPLVPLAILSFAEELRSDVQATLQDFRAAGVDLKVISGDDPGTVRAIGRRVGLTVDGPAAAGPELAAMPDDELDRAADAAQVFGRVDPPLKARLVEALRRQGRYVAMVGDGVNDILSLRRANLGIAMESGSSATRGVADIVLVGDQFAVLPRAVVEGRRIVAAMEAVLILLLTRTFAMLLLLTGAALAGLPVPITPRQNSILAFAAVGLPLLVVAVRIPPRRPPRSLLAETLRISIPVGIAAAVTALPVFAWLLAQDVALGEARTMVTTLMIFIGLGVLPLVLAGSRRDGGARVPGRWPWVLAGQMLLAYLVVLEVPPLRAFFGLEPLGLDVIAALLAGAVLWTLVVHAVRATGLGAPLVDGVSAGVRGLVASRRRS